MIDTNLLNTWPMNRRRVGLGAKSRVGSHGARNLGRLNVRDREKLLEDSFRPRPDGRPDSDLDNSVERFGVLGALEYVFPVQLKDIYFSEEQVEESVRLVFNKHLKSNLFSPEFLVYSSDLMSEANDIYSEVLSKIVENFNVEAVGIEEVPAKYRHLFWEGANRMKVPIGFASRGWFWKNSYADMSVYDIAVKSTDEKVR
jgi:hypothetical protein